MLAAHAAGAQVKQGTPPTSRTATSAAEMKLRKLNTMPHTVRLEIPPVKDSQSFAMLFAQFSCESVYSVSATKHDIFCLSCNHFSESTAK
jgi:hypothetical protein